MFMSTDLLQNVCHYFKEDCLGTLATMFPYCSPPLPLSPHTSIFLLYIVNRWRYVNLQITLRHNGKSYWQLFTTTRGLASVLLRLDGFGIAWRFTSVAAVISHSFVVSRSKVHSQAASLFCSIGSGLMADGLCGSASIFVRKPLANSNLTGVRILVVWSVVIARMVLALKWRTRQWLRHYLN